MEFLAQLSREGMGGGTEQPKLLRVLRWSPVSHGHMVAAQCFGVCKEDLRSERIKEHIGYFPS